MISSTVSAKHLRFSDNMPFKNLACAFSAAENEILASVDRAENYIEAAISRASVSGATSENRLKSLVAALRANQEFSSLKRQIGVQLRSCRNEAASLNSSFVKFAQTNIDPECREFKRLLGLPVDTHEDVVLEPEVSSCTKKQNERQVEAARRKGELLRSVNLLPQFFIGLRLEKNSSILQFFGPRKSRLETSKCPPVARKNPIETSQCPPVASRLRSKQVTGKD